MKILYLSRQYLYRDIIVKELKKIGHHVDVYEYIKEVGDLKRYDFVYIEAMDESILRVAKIGVKKLVLFTRGVEVYESGFDKLNWSNIDRLVFLSQHQGDYFKRRYKNSDWYKPKAISVLPLPCPHEYFPIKNNLVKNNKVALVANVTDRKGTYQIPRFLQMFPYLHIYHLGRVEKYGNPVAEFVRWRLEKDGTANRYHREKKIPFENMKKWYQDKTYVWLPTISEGFNRAVMEGMCVGLMPIVRRFAGADSIWMKDSLYDEMDEIPEIIKKEYKPKTYRDYVIERYHPDKIIEIFKTFL